MPASKADTFEFGSFRADVARRLLERDGEPIPLSGKAFEILMVLLQNAGELVDKETLMQEVWPDTAVEENNLTVNISALRKALGDSAASPRLIITVSGRGYRFAGELRSNAMEQTAVAPVLARKPSLWKPILAYALVLTTIATMLWIWLRPKPARSIAVLPFRVLNQDAANEYLGIGLTDALITRLSNFREIEVRPLSSVAREEGKDPFLAGADVSVDSVVEGSVQTADNRVRVSVRMLRVRDKTPLWAESFDEAADNLLAIEDSISARIASSLARRLSELEKQPIGKRPTSNAAAYENYLRGRYYAAKYNEDGFRKALGYLQSAIDADPSYALAYSGLADAYYAASNMILPPSDAMPRAKAAAQRAVALDPALAEAHVSLGLIASKYEWNWGEAEKEFHSALELDPNSAQAHLWFGLYRAQMGHTARAIAELRRAQEIDPLSNDINGYLGTTLYWARRYSDALQQAHKVVEFDPAFVPGHVGLCWILAAQNKLKEAVAACEKARGVDGSPWTTLALARAYALDSNRTAAEQELEQVRKSGQFVSGYDLAVVYAALERRDDAFAALDDAFEHRAEWLGYLKIDPQVDVLRDDPRFARLLKKLGI